MGAGNLGLADYPGFRREGFEIVAMFDTADAKIATIREAACPSHDIRDTRKVLKREKVDIVVLAVPARSAQHVLDQVASGRVKAVLNCRSTLLVPDGIKMKSVDLTVSAGASRSSSRRAIRRPGKAHARAHGGNPR